MNTNPSYGEVQLGDVYISASVPRLSGVGYLWYTSTVIELKEVSMRFGKPDRIVGVRVVSNDGTLVDVNKLIWVSQLLKGLV